MYYPLTFYRTIMIRYICINQFNKLIMKKIRTFFFSAAIIALNACSGYLGYDDDYGNYDYDDYGDGNGGGVPELIISSAAIDNPATAGQRYQFEFTARNLFSGLNEVTFEWTFGTGTDGTGNHTTSVSGRRATHQVSHEYASDGMYALVVVVKDNQGNVIVDKSFIVAVGSQNERDYDLDVCDEWRAAGSGGQGGTIDNWDISDLPVGAKFDLRFEAYSIPDKFIVEYRGQIVYDSGWRGSSQYEGDPLYPGGIAGAGAGQKDDLFTKISGSNTFKVIVLGPGPGTAWNYSVRARCD